MSSKTNKQNEGVEAEKGSVETNKEVVPTGSVAQCTGIAASVKGTFSPGEEAVALDKSETETEEPKKGTQKHTPFQKSSQKVATVITSVASAATHVLPVSIQASQNMTFESWKSVRENLLFNPASSETVRNLNKVIFPNGKWIRRWDAFTLVLLFFLLFYLPYQIGVSAGAEMDSSIAWVVFHFIVVLVFIIDTILYFYRPFQYPDGRWCVDLKTIQRKYLRGMFIVDFLSMIPWNLITYFVSEVGSERSMVLLFGLLKLLRLIRLERLLVDSQVITDIRMKYNSQWLQLIKYTFFIVVICHYIACIWCWVALIENGNADFDKNENWIQGWVLSNEPLGDFSPHPIGADNHAQRYVISLFFAVQTITSIGYGNIAPQTIVEWWIGSFLQLVAGISWAYTIGGLIGVAAGFNAEDEEFGQRADEANELIKAFETENELENDFDNPNSITIGKDEVSRRIRGYIYQQYRSSSSAGYCHGLNNAFPTMKTLPPDLQKQASVLLLRGYLDYVNYLSSYYLSYEEQGELILKCFLCEFPAGELVNLNSGHSGLGRGIYLLQSGCAYYARDASSALGGRNKRMLLTGGAMIGAGRVLLEDGHKEIEGSRLFFLAFSKVLFIPRDAITKLLENNTQSWKGSGRYFYARTLLGHCDVIQTSVI